MKFRGPEFVSAGCVRGFPSRFPDLNAALEPASSITYGSPWPQALSLASPGDVLVEELHLRLCRSRADRFVVQYRPPSKRVRNRSLPRNGCFEVCAWVAVGFDFAG